MILLLSGEGPSDIGGSANGSNVCGGDDFRTGPMGCLVDQIVEAKWGYSPLASKSVHWVSEGHLADLKPELPKRSPKLKLPGAEKPVESTQFYGAARAMAYVANQMAQQVGDEVIAVLFHDSDGTSGKQTFAHWQAKCQSMQDGFAVEQFDYGVPMLPRPKSEAWLLCAKKQNQPYQHCATLEEASGNDRSPNNLKQQLTAAVGGVEPGTDEQCRWFHDGEVDIERIDMPSFNAFKQRLCECLDALKK